MPLQQTSGAASYDAFGGGVAAVPKYIEEYFSTFLYQGTGAAQTITNGIDLSTKGGLVWMKDRGSNPSYQFNVLVDTARAGILISNATDAAGGSGQTTYNTDGFRINAGYTAWNSSGQNYVSWSIAKSPKFFDIVTYTGTGSVRTVAHNLGSAPGCIIIKCTNASGYNWIVYHRSLGSTKSLKLQTTDAESTSAVFFNNTDPTSTEFTVNTNASINESGNSFVAYLFAHNAGGFGLTGTDNVISCGSFTTDSGGEGPVVNLGWEPQWIIQKDIDYTSGSGGDWDMFDNMRGLPSTSSMSSKFLEANTSAAEQSNGYMGITSTGFRSGGTADHRYIYIAIRRGPMKVPTSGTSVFSPNTATYSANQVVTTGFPVDMLMMKGRTITLGTLVYDRLRGLASTNTSPYDAQLFTSDTSAETAGDYTNTANNTGYQISAGFSGFSSVNYNFRRAPSFFDEVCYTGNSAGITISHNLAAVPELIIEKRRSGTSAWYVFAVENGWGELQSTAAWGGTGNGSGTNTIWQATASTVALDSTFAPSFAASGSTYVAYLFATCAGVSKVTTFTGNGSSQTINCGFTGGARFVLIKRVDSTGNWVTFDTARGISSGNDPALYLNSTAAEVTGVDAIDPDSTGFIVNQESTFNLNVSSATYLVLAIA